MGLPGKQVRPGWYQDPDNPDIYRSYINRSAVNILDVPNKKTSNDYIYEIDIKSGDATLKSQTGFLGGTQTVLFVQPGNEASFNVTNYNQSAFKPLVDEYGLDFMRLHDIAVGYSKVAYDNFTTGPQKEKLSKLARFKRIEAQRAPAPSKNGGTDNPDTGGANTRQPTSESGANFPFGSLRTVQNFTEKRDTYQNFKYPTTIESGQDYMIINIFNYKVADIFGSGGVANISPEAFLAGQSLSSRQFNELKESLAHIRLPVPNNIMEANQTKWGSSELNNLAAGLLAGATGIVGGVATGDFMTAGEYTDATVRKILEGNTPGKTLIKQKLTLGAASTLINKLGVKVDAEAFRARATGTVVNPNLELLFNGPSLRQFQFQYKLTPRSLEEAKQIRGIIKTFKKAMAPKRGTAAEDAFFLGAPNVFQLKFMRGTGENKYLPSIKTCALTNFSANYTADGFYSAYYDGQPISIDIVLQFGELTPIYNDHYEIDTDSVGFTKDLNELEKSTTKPVENKPAAEPPAQTRQPRTVEEAQAIVETEVRATLGTNVPGIDPIAPILDPKGRVPGTLVRTTETAIDLRPGGAFR